MTHRVTMDRKNNPHIKKMTPFCIHFIFKYVISSQKWNAYLSWWWNYEFVLTLANSSRNENLSLLVWIKFLNLFLYTSKNWKNYRSNKVLLILGQRTGINREDWVNTIQLLSFDEVIVWIYWLLKKMIFTEPERAKWI